MARVFNLSSNSEIPKTSGWYQSKNSPNSHASLLLSDSSLEIPGVIKFTGTEFQGCTAPGTWQTFNASVGPTGAPGANFNAMVSLLNLGDGDGKLFNTSRTMLGGDYSSNLPIKSLKGSTSMRIINNEDTIELEALPRPMIWDMSRGLPILNDSDKLEAFGDVWLWKVGKVHVKTGQAVCITVGEQVEPLVYTMPLDMYRKNATMCGISLDNGAPNDVIRVCSKGICPVKLSSNIPREFISSSETRDYGLPGLVAPDGFIFHSPTKPSIECIIAGTFMKLGNLGKPGDLVWFKL